MKPLRLATAGFVILLLGIAYSQQVIPYPPIPPAWVENLDGVHFSIALSNHVIAPGSTNILQCRFENSSTNLTFLAEPYWGGTSLYLTNSAGKVYPLTPGPFSRGSYGPARKVKPDESYEWSVLLTIPKSVEAGRYKLAASREIGRFSPGETKPLPGGELVSNSLDVEIKR